MRFELPLKSFARNWVSSDFAIVSSIHLSHSGFLSIFCFFIVYLVIFMYAHRNRNGCAALLYLYRSLYYFRTQILLHFYMYIVWHSKAFGNNTNGLRLCVSVVVGWLFFVQLPLLIFYLYRSKWTVESTINVLNCVRCTLCSTHRNVSIN